MIEGQPKPWPRTPRTALGYGIALVPEDRKGQGLVLGMSVASNMTMASMEKVSRAGVLSSLAMKNSSLSVARDFGLAERHLLSTVRNLSGGNQQKALLGKWRLKTPRVLLVDEPTRGIDIGAKEEILATLKRMALQGLAVVIVSSELEEVVEISDRVVVLSAGRRVAELTASDVPVRVQDILNAAFEVGVNEHDR
jgi:ABC-type sugar transport system ATPase subunit